MKISPFSLIYVFLDKHSSPSGLSNSVQYSDTNLVSSSLPTCMSLTVWTMDFFFFFSVLFHPDLLYSMAAMLQLEKNYP